MSYTKIEVEEFSVSVIVLSKKDIWLTWKVKESHLDWKGRSAYNPRLYYTYETKAWKVPEKSAIIMYEDQDSVQEIKGVYDTFVFDIEVEGSFYPASGDGWNEPRIPAGFEDISAYSEKYGLDLPYELIKKYFEEWSELLGEELNAYYD